MMYALYNPLKGWTLYDLTAKEVQLLLQSMSTNEVKLLKICQSGAATWEAFSEAKHESLMSAPVAPKGSYPDIKAEEENLNEDTDYFVIKPKKVFYPRLHDRIDIELTVSIEQGKSHFTTSTKDISAGGLNFAEPLPDWVAGYFIVKISHKDQVYSVMCSLVEDQKQKHRVQIVSEESDPHFQKYKNLLAQLN